MGLFDHLFKPRPDLESIVEAPLRASGLSERSPDVKGEVPPDPATAFLQPKGYAQGAANLARAGQAQGFVPVLPHAKRAVAPERKVHPEEDPAVAANLVVLTLGDVMARIPVSFLRPEVPDLKRELRFHFEDLAADITRGRPAIALSCIANQCPDIFRGPISDADDMAIRLPLQKLVEQAARLRPPTAAAVSVVIAPTARIPVAAPVEKLPVETPTLVPVAPIAPIAPPVAERIVEHVVPVASPPIAPPAVAPPPPVLVVLPPPVISEPPPARESPIVEPERAPPILVPEPVAEMKPPQAAEPPPVAAPEPVQPIVEPAVVADEKQQPAPEPPIEVPQAIADEPEPAPEPARLARTPPLGNEIELSLAALVAKVPREMIGEPLPRIDESIRITLPFQMIERQLGGGKVEIPARLFWTALPPLLKHYFVMREDQLLELPLEEIFQNLPVGGGREKVGFGAIAPVPGPTMEREAPIVLAPVPEEPATPELDFDRSPTPAPPAEAEYVLPPVAELAQPVAEPVPAAAVVAAEPSPIAEPAPCAAVVVEEPIKTAELTLGAEEPVKIATPELVMAIASEPPVVPATAPEPASPVFAEAPPVEIAAASAAPEEERPALVNLQPFRVFAPPSPTVEPEPVAEPTEAASILLGEAPPAAVESPHILRFPAEAAAEPKEVPPAAQAEVAEEPQVAPPPAPAPPVEEKADSKFAVLPPPEPEPEKVSVVAPPVVEPIAAFDQNQPPPLKVEEPAGAVAVLRATVPAPQEQPAIGMATASVQPPRLFRPMVLPPPIAGFVPAPSVNLAPTLSGSVAPAPGLISLALEAAPPASPFSAPPPSPEPVRAEAAPVEVPQPATTPPAAAPPQAAAAETPPVEHRESAPKLKNLVRRFFPSSLVAPEPESLPVAASPVATPPDVDEARRVAVPPAAFAPPPAPEPAPVTPPSNAAPSRPEVTSKATMPPAALVPPPTPAPSPVTVSPAEPSSTPAASPAPAPAPPNATADVPFQLPLPPLPQAAPTAPPPPQHAPPSLPISRLDQSSLQALFMTEETLDLSKISRLAAALPGLQACTIVARGETFSSGNLPEGFHLNALRGLSPQVGAAADRLPIGNLKNFTLYGEQYSVSFFERPAVCLCAIHRSRSFIPGVREKLVAVVDELARG